MVATGRPTPFFREYLPLPASDGPSLYAFKCGSVAAASQEKGVKVRSEAGLCLPNGITPKRLFAYIADPSPLATALDVSFAGPGLPEDIFHTLEP